MKEKYLRDYLNINKYKDVIEISGYSTGSDNNFEDEYLSGYNKNICYGDFLDILSKNSKNSKNISPENPVEKGQDGCYYLHAAFILVKKLVM